MPRPDIRRMWINQPSVLGTDHSLHGTNVLAVFPGEVAKSNGQTYVDVYFTEGLVTSSIMSTLSLSEGWIE